MELYENRKLLEKQDALTWVTFGKLFELSGLQFSHL